MPIRECALKNSAFQKLKHVYENREYAVRVAKASGKTIVGTLGCDVPEEVIMAAGMMPMPVYAIPGGRMDIADKYLEYAFDPMVRAQFEKIVDGSCNGLMDTVVVSNSTDVLIRVYLYLRELHRVEPSLDFPPVYFIDWLFTRNRMHQERNRLTLSLFMEEMRKLSGSDISETSVKEAASLVNETKFLLRSIDAFRTSSDIKITGTEMLVIIGAGFFMEKQEYNSLLRAILIDIDTWPNVTGKRIFYTGSVQTDTVLYEAVENEGAVIVGEDHDWGARYFDRDFDLSLPAVRGLVDEYMLREFSSKKSFVSQRVLALDREVSKSGADGVLFYFHIYEEAASWDYPEQKKVLEEKGIDTVQFAKFHWPATDEELNDFKTKIRAFVAGEKV